ncbi:DUF393 domain-containing protein [Candidatus Uhrbacteria bacterium]|nr:DUF393 domain-containing protein [Candidatus Uhrbacteria bacterium]
MSTHSHVPVLVYDGACQFCRVWAARLKWATGDYVSYRPFQEVAKEFPEIPLSTFEQSVKLIFPNGEALSGAHAIVRALAEVPGKGRLLWSYRHLPGFAPASEFLYRRVASCRTCAFEITKRLVGSRRIKKWEQIL